MSTLPTGYLALPDDDGARLARALFRKVRLRALYQLLHVPVPKLSAPVAHALPAVRRALLALARDHDAAVHAALGAPDVLVPVLSMESDLGHPDGALRVAVPSLLASLASAGHGPDVPLAWPVPVTDVYDGTRRAHHHFAPAARGLKVHADRVWVLGPDGQELTLGVAPEPSPYHPIGARQPGWQLAVRDSNPLSDFEAHPDKHGNAVDLGGHPAAEWCARLGAALDVVAATLPALHAELAVTLTRVVPVGYHAETHLSASYREGPGLIYMSLHPSDLTMAEAVVHETQHGKLNAVTWLDPVLDNAFTEWTTSPVRPDERPLMGVLLAAHAFVPVAALHQRLDEIDHALARDPGFARRRGEVLATNQKSLDILARLAQPTRVGRQILEALNTLHRATCQAAPAGLRPA